jgi:hypothetical protein
VQSLRCDFPVRENHRHSGGLGGRDAVSGHKFEGGECESGQMSHKMGADRASNDAANGQERTKSLRGRARSYLAYRSKPEGMKPIFGTTLPQNRQVGESGQALGRIPEHEVILSRDF